MALENLSHKANPSSKRMYWLTDGLEVVEVKFLDFDEAVQKQGYAWGATGGHWWWEGGDFTPSQALSDLRGQGVSKH